MQPWAAAVVLVLAAGCAGAPGPAFTATLTSPTDIELRWPDDPEAAGHRIEYANDPAGPWTTLRFLPAHATTYHHPDLIPQTRFFYREQPFFGPVSGETTAGAPPATSSGTAPAALRAAVRGDVVTFTWQDRSANEAGFLLELRRPGAAEFDPVAVTDPDATTCELALVAGEEGAAFRLRALRFGPLSPVVAQTTGKEQ